MEYIYSCAQQEALIDYLYGELSEADARAFQRHMKECSACAADLAGLNLARSSVVAWHDDTIGSVDLNAEVRSPVSALPRRSAVAAFREFFNLSPLWLKGAVGFAAVVFCVLAVIAIAHRQQSVSTPLVAVARPSQEELNALVQRRVDEELAQRKQLEAQNPLKETVARNTNVEQSRPFKKRETVATNSLNHSPRRPLSKVEREQLALDLGLVTSNDSDLDLLEDKINQPE